MSGEILNYFLCFISHELLFACEINHFPIVHWLI